MQNIQRPSSAAHMLHTTAQMLMGTKKKKTIFLGASLLAIASMFAFSQGTAPTIPAINLSADPLYAATTGDKPTLALALSVEYPTVGAQYVDPDNNNSSTTDDPTYSPTNEYLGYYDAESCYTYDKAGTGAPTGKEKDYQRFVRRGPAIPLATPDPSNPTKTTRMCWDGTKSYTKDDGTTPASSTVANDAFSGNFLNWASSSAIDMLRLALTGGDRVIDTPTLTVLQRAVIPDGDPINMGNSSNFPSKQLYRSGTSRAITAANFASTSYASGVPYFGAVPTSMATAAGNNDIFVANTLNRIYFGTSKSGNNSSSFGSYTLGSAGTSVYQIGTIVDNSTALTVNNGYQVESPSRTLTSRDTSTYCASKDGTCTLPAGTWEVFYGRDGRNDYRVVAATGSLPCSESIFGDPAGSSEKCYYRAYSGTWTPSTSSATQCASEGSTCTLPSGTWEIVYGASSSWKVAPATGSVPCTNTIFGDPIFGTPKACYYRPYTGTWTPTTTASLNTEGYFFARVQVCDRNPTTYELKERRYWELCRQYSDGANSPHPSYKPTGVIQKYSDQLRLAAFGYLLDQTASYYSGGRYGGVLRAPMKFVGTKTYDISGNPNNGTNSQAEWDSTTGVFKENPDGNTTIATADGRNIYLSGVINYLNQFGRTGSVAGKYKMYDPVGELHYEALRYLQGLPPSADAVSNITTAMYDGYPVAYDSSTGWTDPYGDGRSKDSDYSCARSNIVVIGDKNTHDGNRLPSASAANNIPDISYWRSVVQNFEKNVTSTYLDGKGVSRTTANPNGANNSVPTNTARSQIMGSAYWAHTHDIRGTSWTNATSSGSAGTDLQRPGLRVKTFMFDVNEYGASNDANTRRTSNQLFMAAKYGGFEADPSNSSANPYNTYGNPFINEATGIANKYVWEDTDTRTSRVGEANTYFLQSDARGVLSAFDDIFNRAATSAFNIGGGANNNKNTYSNNSTIYQGKFDTSDWSGDVEARLTSTGALVWSAATRLNAMLAPATNRNIVVGKSGATATPVAVDFRWDTNALDTSLVTQLNAGDSLGEDRLNYLRGDKSKEGIKFRARNKLIGDIVNSGVVYSGAPSTSINGAGYSTFISTNSSRTPAVFAGANDGMLHAFNATTGDELFAYIPSWMGSRLAALTDKAYGTTGSHPHLSYVDAIPTVSEAYVDSAWKTVLVGGTGGGGQGVFALDVTDPSSFTASNVMWEFTHTDDSDLGNVTGKPQILKLRTNAANATTPTYKWFAVVASGVNSYVADSNNHYGTGAPALFLLDLSKSPGTAWAQNTNYYKITLPFDATLSATKPTGLINFTAELGPDGAVTMIYTGDLHGNLWKLDFSLSAGTSEWDMNKLSSFNKGTVASPSPYPLFTARSSSGAVQPITMSPLVAPGPTPDTRYVYFGTGKYYESSDKSNIATQSAYMVFDNGSNSGDTLPNGVARVSAVSGRARLKAGTISTATKTLTTPSFTMGRAATDNDSETIRSGWYADFPASGEREISDASLIRLSSKVVFSTLLPGSATSNGCSTALDSGNQYTVDLANGGGSYSASAVGLLGETMLIERTDLTANSKSPTNNTGRGIAIITTEQWQLGSGGSRKVKTIETPVEVGRISWRQIYNYQNLKN